MTHQPSRIDHIEAALTSLAECQRRQMAGRAGASTCLSAAEISLERAHAAAASGHEKRVSELLNANTREVERRRRAEALLRRDRDTYRRYEQHHRAKGTDESLTKAHVNAALADAIELHLADPYQEKSNG